MLNSIKTLKRYCKVTLNVFFNKNFLMMTKKSDSYNRNFTTEQVKIVENSRHF